MEIELFSSASGAEDARAVALAMENSRRLQAPSTPVETRACVPFENVRGSIINSRNTDSVCTAGGQDCPVCCRVFEWLVCDRQNALTHLQCVCNSRTSFVSDPPSSQPTLEPTEQPTNPPTSRPTQSLTDPPTLPPTKIPTVNPTGSPTNKPTVVPSDSPTTFPTMPPSNSSTPVPSSFPTAVPSDNPTPAPLRITESPTTSPDPTPRQSEAPSMSPSLPPSSLQAIASQSPTGSEIVEVLEIGEGARATSCRRPLPEEIDPTTNEPTMPNLSQSTYSYTYQMYLADASSPALNIRVTRNLQLHIHEFVTQDFFECNYQEATIVRYETTPHVIQELQSCVTTDATPANGGAECLVVTASETVEVYEPRSSSRRRSLQGGSATQSALEQYVRDINVFINTGMGQGLFPGPPGVWSQFSYTEGPGMVESPPSTPSPSSSPAQPTNSPTLVPTTVNPTLDPTPNPASFSEVNRGDSAASENSDGLENSVVIVLAVVGGLLFVGLLLALFTRGGKSSDSYAYEEKDDLEDDDLGELYPAASPSPKYQERELPPPRIMARKSGRVIRTDMNDEDGEDPYTSLTPPSRAKRGPLSNMDELDRVHTEQLASFSSEDEMARQVDARDTVDL